MRRRIERRTTKQKRVILEELKKTSKHPTAYDIFRAVKRRIPSISFGTVYRNLNLLRDDSKILEVTCGKYSSRYDGDIREHSHFFCLGCNKIFDLDEMVLPRLDGLDGKAGKRLGAVVTYHRLSFYGYCRKCKERGGVKWKS